MPSTLPPPGAGHALYIIDLSSYIFRAYHAIAPLSSPTGEPTHATYGTIAMLQKLIGERKPAMLAVAMDSKGPTFRSELYQAYKATRPPAPDDLSVQLARSREIVEAYRIPIFQRSGVEADDLIATVVDRALHSGLTVVVVSSDKDLMQLVGDRVVMWDTMRDKVYGPAEVQEKHGVPPEQMRDLLALMGDTSDNIPGVPSVGPKTAADLMRQFRSIDELYRRIEEVPKKRIKELLKEHEAAVRLSQQLVTLRRGEAIEWDMEGLQYGGADLDKLRTLYTQLGFARMIAAIPAPSRSAAALQSDAKPRVYTSVHDLAGVRAWVQRAERSGAFAFDLHTTSSNPMLAAVVGVSLAIEPLEAVYVPAGHRYLGAPPQVAWGELKEELRPLWESPVIAKVGHDLKFSHVLLSREGIALRGELFDPMVASYLLNPEADHELPRLAKRELDVDLQTFDEVTGRSRSGQLAFDEVDLERATPYAAAKVDLALRLRNKLHPQIEQQGLSKVMSTMELPLLPVLAGMERVGVLVDFEELGRLRAMVDAEMQTLEQRAKEHAGRDFNVNSPRQLEVILFDEIGLKPSRRTKTARSTDADVLEALAAQHPLPAVLLEHRQLAKLKGTYIDALPLLMHKQTGRIHTSWSQTVAATGRISSSDPNLQNIPIRTELGKAIRRAFTAPPGARLVSADYSQIELRVMAHLSHDPVLVDAFRRGQDIHTRTAMEVFEVDEAAVTEAMRRQAKTINFGVIYGMGEVALAKRLDIPRAKAASFIEAYFRRYAGVRTFLDDTLAAARKGEAVTTLFGRQRLLPNLRSSNGMLRAAAERIAQNTPIQGTAADLLKLAMLRLDEPVVPGARMVLTVHDELVFEVPEDLVAEAMPKIKSIMEGVAELEVPLEVDIGSGVNWGEAH